MSTYQTQLLAQYGIVMGMIQCQNKAHWGLDEKPS